MTIFSTWFQSGPIPADAMTGHYSVGLVVLSYVIAVFASFVALNFVGRIRAEKTSRNSLYWVAGGAFTMGAGIWSMHFIGMLAFIMPMPMTYDFGWTSVSLLTAMLASGSALLMLRKNNYTLTHLALSGIFIGLGIATMHYMGMQGMKTQVTIHYLPGLFFLSIIIAIGAAEAALWLALQSNKGSLKRQFNLKIVSALVMGAAICAMHYTGMEAAVFTPKLSAPNYEEINPDYLAFFVAGVTLLIIGMALLASSYYKKMVNAVQNEKEFLNAMLDNLEDGIIACDAEGKITVVNQALQKHMHLKKENKHINQLFDYFQLYTMNDTLVSAQDSPLQLALQGERIHGHELIMRFKNEVSRDVVVDGQQIVNSDKKTLGAVTVFHDVTELKKTEKFKKEFVSIVSHELRTPLTSIRGSIGLLVSGMMGEFPEKAGKLLKIANSNCERLLLLINDILDVEKIEAGKMDFQLKPINLAELVMDSIDANKMYADKFGLSIQLIKPPSSVTVKGDPDRLMQVMDNLISNACKFSPPNEQVTLGIKKMQGMVRVTVSDKGAGIPEEFQPMVFSKFSQADSSSTRGKGGTGLGLSISKMIIEKLGGTLHFNSKVNAGTTFYFDLPLYTEKSEPAKTSLKQPKKERRILFCDDDQDLSDYFKVLLESAGFTVDIATTVKEAKKLVAVNQYDALLLDLILPDQDGISFIRELRADEKTSGLQIIVLSVMADTGRAILNGEAFAVVDWLDKPIDFNKLLLSINKIKTKNIPRILHIEDNVDTQHIVGTLLEKYAEVESASSLEKAKSMLEHGAYDLIILDLLLPDGNGIEILPFLAKYKLPVLVFSNTELNKEYSQYVSHALLKSSSSNEMLLQSIMALL
ncbi:MAG: MHYT domain-containing protein [Tatlockia sp.]|jgi:PAS domain S-box-containing protein